LSSISNTVGTPARARNVPDPANVHACERIAETRSRADSTAGSSFITTCAARGIRLTSR
jgi:hypothetical protein